MSLRTISPASAKKLIAQGATLIDVRGSDEHARERISGASNKPLGELKTLGPTPGPVIFHCKSGARTAANARNLASAAQTSDPQCEAYILEGGIEAWKAAGLPVSTDKSQPIEIMRQVQITAGSLVLLGVLLSMIISPSFVWLPAFIGAGLVLSGVSGSCMMAQVLGQMPWNKRATTQA